jgi:uncharacterized membrane protein
MQIDQVLAGTHARLRVLIAACLAAAILHILATLAAPRMAGSTPFARLSPIAPLHRFEVLAPVTPQTQPLPFMAPDVRYAICRYDTAKGPVNVSVRLPGRGWSLNLYTPEGDNFYTSVGQDGQTSDIALQLTPVADRFLGLTPEARGKIAEATSTLSVATGRGMVVVRAPDQGLAYRTETEAVLKRATCSAQPF